MNVWFGNSGADLEEGFGGGGESHGSCFVFPAFVWFSFAHRFLFCGALLRGVVVQLALALSG